MLGIFGKFTTLASSDATIVNRIEILPNRIEYNRICFRPNRPAVQHYALA